MSVLVQLLITILIWSPWTSLNMLPRASTCLDSFEIITKGEKRQWENGEDMSNNTKFPLRGNSTKYSSEVYNTWACSSNHLPDCLVQYRQHICLSERFGIPFRGQSRLHQPSIQIIQKLCHWHSDNTLEMEANCERSLSSPIGPNVIKLHPPKCGIKE